MQSPRASILTLRFAHSWWYMVQPSDFRLLTFIIDGVLYSDAFMGFGSSIGPAHYDELGRALMHILRKMGVHTILRITDDHLIIALSLAQSIELTQLAHLLMAHVNMPRALKKDFGPTQEPIFNGFKWNILTQTASIPTDRCTRVLLALNVVLTSAVPLKLGLLRKITGSLAALLAIGPHMKAWLQGMYGVAAATLYVYARKAPTMANGRQTR